MCENKENKSFLFTKMISIFNSIHDIFNDRKLPRQSDLWLYLHCNSDPDCILSTQKQYKI